MCSSEALECTKFAHNATTLPTKSPRHTDDVDPTARPTFTLCTRYTLGAHLDQSRALDLPLSWRLAELPPQLSVATARANLARVGRQRRGWSRKPIHIRAQPRPRERRAPHTCLTSVSCASSSRAVPARCTHIAISPNPPPSPHDAPPPFRSRGPHAGVCVGGAMP